MDRTAAVSLARIAPRFLVSRARRCRDRRCRVGYRDTAFDRWRGGRPVAAIACRIIEAHRGALWALRSFARLCVALPLSAA